jgi:hypothetical protein
MQSQSPRSLRRAYIEWVEEQIERYKDSVSRNKLLDLADEVCRELRVSSEGQYQLTEVLLCTAIDRRLVKMLNLPSYRAWLLSQDDGAPAPQAAPAAAAPRPAEALPDGVIPLRRPARVPALRLEAGDAEVCVV